MVFQHIRINIFALFWVVVQIARAVEIHHVKVLQYRPRTSDLLIVAGLGWKEGVVGSATLSADLRSPPGRAFKTAEPVSVHNLPPHPFIIERAYPDGWSSLGSAGGGQH